MCYVHVDPTNDYSLPKRTFADYCVLSLLLFRERN